MPGAEIIQMKEYRYSSLESDEIRLLELFAGDPGTELRGRLERYRMPEHEEPGSGQRLVVTRDGVNVPDVPMYQVLSCVWGQRYGDAASNWNSSER